jgi:uncharacterized protein
VSSSSYLHERVVRINVGYLLAQSPGYSRDITINIPQRLRLEDAITESLIGDLRLTRTSEGILVQGALQCSTFETCSRCLTETEITFPILLEELFGTPPHYHTQFIIGEDNILDLAPLLREELLLGIPTQVLCKPDCKGLCPECGSDLNLGPCECDLDKIDPRWTALSELQNRLTKDD